MSDPVYRQFLSVAEGQDPTPEAMKRIRTQLTRALEADAGTEAPSAFDEAEGDELEEIDTVALREQAAETKQTGSSRSRWPFLAAVATVVAVVAIATGFFADDDGPRNGSAIAPAPDEVLRGYQDARNAGDVNAVMAFYAEDAVVLDPPTSAPVAADGLARGVDEIRVIEAFVPTIQGTSGGIEFLNTTVSGNTLTFNTKFINRFGECFGRSGDQVTVVDGKIVLYDFGPDDPTQCE